MGDNIRSLISYHRNRMDELMKRDDTEAAHIEADGLLRDLVIVFARQANVTDEQADIIGSILTDFEEMEKPS